MQTQISEKFRRYAAIDEAEAILRRCVHCGFCTATCPTYQLLGDELDSPRGRIYLIKQMLEGEAVSAETQHHLDRCLSCRNCETTCPSGVEYVRLADIGRRILEQEVTRPWHQKLFRYALRAIIPHRERLACVLAVAQRLKPILPKPLKKKLPTNRRKPQVSSVTSERKMLVLPGCAQAAATPSVNQAARKVLAHQGTELIEARNTGCCGALSYHMSAVDEAKSMAKRNVDILHNALKNGAECIVSTASGCGVMYQEYPHLLADEPEYADRAREVVEHIRDISQVIDTKVLHPKLRTITEKLAFHAPCTLQHGLKLDTDTRALLEKLGFTLTECAESHMCCGSAGSYSILQPDLSERLLERKLHHLQSDGAEHIVTANVGCQLHLASKAQLPVNHWVELLADHLPD